MYSIAPTRDTYGFRINRIHQDQSVQLIYMYSFEPTTEKAPDLCHVLTNCLSRHISSERRRNEAQSAAS